MPVVVVVEQVRVEIDGVVAVEEGAIEADILRGVRTDEGAVKDEAINLDKLGELLEEDESEEELLCTDETNVG